MNATDNNRSIPGLAGAIALLAAMAILSLSTVISVERALLSHVSPAIVTTLEGDR